MMNEFDLQAEAERDWWRDAHDMAEGRRLKLEKACEQALANLEKAMEADELADVWKCWQKARKTLRGELT